MDSVKSATNYFLCLEPETVMDMSTFSDEMAGALIGFIGIKCVLYGNGEDLRFLVAFITKFIYLQNFSSINFTNRIK